MSTSSEDARLEAVDEAVLAEVLLQRMSDVASDPETGDVDARLRAAGASFRQVKRPLDPDEVERAADALRHA